MKKNGFAPLLTILIIAILGVVVYLGYKSYTPQSQSSSVVNSETVRPTTSIDTSNWIVFNSNYKYSIRLPSGWTAGAPGGSDPKTFYDPVFENSCDYDKGDRCMQIFVSSIPHGSNANPNDPLPMIDESNNFAPDFIIDPKDEISNKVSLSVDGEKAVGFDYFQATYAGTRWLYVVVFDHNNTRYTITYEEQKKDSGVLTPTTWKNKSIFDQIVSTFKFVK